LELGEQIGQDLRDQRLAPGADGCDVAVADHGGLTRERAVGVGVRHFAAERLVALGPGLDRVRPDLNAEPGSQPVEVQEA
jgi:hypothetical protein